MGNNVHDSSMSKLNIHSVDVMTHLGQSETNTVHKFTDQYCQPQKIYKKQKNLFAFAVAVNPTLDPTTLHPQNSKYQRKTEKASPQGEHNEPR